MSCRNLTVTNGNPSLLEQKIQEIEGREDVDNLLAYFRTPSFMGEFGDYVTAYNEGTILDYGNRVDENGEPYLFYNETAKKHFYIDKKGEKIYFPIVNRGLRGVFNYKKLDAITSQLALNYFQESVKNDFNDIDFTDAINLPSLKPFLKNKIEAKIKELNNGNFNQKINAKLLTKTLDFLDEWVDNVDAFYKKIGLNRKDNLDEAEDELGEIEEDLKDPIYNKASFERDTKEAVSTNVKLRLSLLKDNNNIDPIWNEPAFIKFDEIYSTILQKLAGNVAITKDGITEDIFEIYKDQIQKIVAQKPYFQTLIDYLQSEDFTEDNKNEFTQAFNLHKNNFLITEISNVNNNFKHVNLGVSDSGSKATIALTQWESNFRNSFLNETNNLTSEGLDKLNSYIKELKILNKIVSDKNSDPEEDFEDNVQDFVKILNKIGVEVTEKGFTYYIEDEGVNQFDFTKQSAKLITTIHNTLISLNKIKESIKVERSEDEYINPFTTQKVFKEMAKAESFYMSEGSDSSIFTGGKSKWLYSYPSYLSTKVLSWKKDRSLLVDALNKSEYTKGSELMKWLLAIEKPYIDSDTESAKRLKNFDIGIFTTMQESGKVDKSGIFKSGESLSSSEISQNDYFIDHVNKVINNDYVRTTTPADKTTDMQIKTGMFISSFGSATASSVIVNEKVQRIFLNYFLSEFNRMRSASIELDSFQNQPEKLKVHYHYKKGSFTTLGNAFRSQYFQDLSWDSKSKNPLVISIKKLLYEKNGRPKMYNNLDINDGIQGILNGEKIVIKDLVNEYITQELSKGIINTSQLFRNQGIIGYDEKTGETVNKLVAKEVFNEMYKGKAAVVSMVSDYYINSLIQNIEYSKMFSGDVAFYKDMIDYKKRIPATYTDGLQLRLKPGEENFNIAIINAVEVASPFLKQLEEMLGKEGAKPYTKINSSDAQAWITPDRWKFLVQRLGKWSKVHDSLYSKMISDNNEQYTEKELKIAAQPLKGVYFELNGSTPVYLKYSQAVLTKRLVQGSPLEKIYNKMIQDERGNLLNYNDQVHEVITLDGIKVGSPTPTDAHNKDGSIKDDFIFNKLSLKNSGWKLQQDLPTKTFKETEVGSQIQKNIFGGLLNNRQESFFLDGGEVTGQDIINELIKTTKSLSDIGVESLKKEFGIDKNGKIKNIEGFYGALVDELTKRGGSKNVIDALNKEIALYGIPQAGSKIINVFSSIITKRTVKIKTNGGSFIQMSNFGMNYEEGTKQGVLWSPDALSTTNEPFLYKDVNNKIRVKPGGILISGSFIAKYIPNYKDYTSEQLFGLVNPETGLRENGIIDGKITENLIGYRIPNQGLASNDALRIVGILPEENGDTVVAYTGITTKTGSDFDIDKMYMMFPSYTLADGRLKYIDSSDNSIQGLQNKLIELYQSVLTNPKVIKDIMKPVDIDFVKNDINNLLPANETSSLYHFDAWNDIQLLYDFRGGKAGVGQEANAVVDINREGILTLNKYFIGWGHTNEEGETLLDKEFSQELTKKDLKKYLEDTNNIGNESVINEITQPRIADTLTAILNGFVDIAKDPFITRGNWVTLTTNVGNLLIRSGMHPLYVISFMAQPILRDYVSYLNSQKSLIQDDHGDMKTKFKKNIVAQELIRETKKFPQLSKSLLQIYEKFVKKDSTDITVFNASDIQSKLYKFLGKPTSEVVTNDDYNKIIDLIKYAHIEAFRDSDVNLTVKSLRDFRSQIKLKSDTGFQLAVLEKFFDLQELSKNIRENVMVSKVDTNGNGKNINSLFAIANMKQHILDKERNSIRGSLKGFNSKFNNTILGVYYNNSILNTIDIVNANPELFPQGQKNVQEIFNEISNDLYGTPATQEEMMSKLEDEYRNFTMAKFFDLDVQESQDLILNLPNRFEEFRKDNRNKYLIVDELQLKNTDGNIKRFIGLNNRKKSPDFEATFVDSWRDLRQDNPKFAEDLIKYSYITSGFNTTPNQFFTYIPHEYFIENNFNDFIIRNTVVDQSDFLDKFYLNNSADNKYIYRLKNDDVISLQEGISKQGLSIPVYDNGFILVETGKARKFVNYSNNIYKLEGYDTDYHGIYTRVMPLGYNIKGNYIVEYGEPFLSKTKEFSIRNKNNINNEFVTKIKNFIDYSASEMMDKQDYFELRSEETPSINEILEFEEGSQLNLFNQPEDLPAIDLTDKECN